MTQTTTFGDLEITYDQRVLSPRAWTANQSTWAAEISTDLGVGPVLELCCGAGQIGLLTVSLTGRPLVCVDADPIACAFTADNAEAAGLQDLVDVRLGRLSGVLGGDERFPLIIADPPWVPRTQTDRFPEDPLLAIDGGDDGLDVARSCLQVIADHLARHGVALLQLGTPEQARLLGEELPSYAADLRLRTVRAFDGGVVARFDRV